MKLKDGMITDSTGDEFIAVATGKVSMTFNGLIRNNKTANFIFNELMTEKSEEELKESLCKHYDVTEEQASKDVHIFLEKLRKAGLLDE